MGIVIEKDKEVLKQYCRAVRTGEDVSHIAEALLTSLKEHNGAGLAANQVGFQVRVFAMSYDPFTDVVIINPVITKERGRQRNAESCLSLPGVHLYIKRPQSVTVKGLDPSGKPVRYRFTGQQTRIACHEIDHLDGKLIIDHGERQPVGV